LDTPTSGSQIRKSKTTTAEEGPGLNSLPDEILLKIFRHVKTSDLLRNVSAVSKRFRVPIL
jgi:hypothetical protein